MSLFAWNCQGLGGPWTVQSLEALIRVHHPSVVFLSETKCSSSKIQGLRHRLNMHSFGVDCHGRSGGLALFWDKSVACTLRNFSSHYIDVTVDFEDGSSPWRFTGF
ncbi:UNVERIFIED_CONTAM: hypothetical protein Sradi_2963500 [Sesamum radiatum]|uniref:Endonuclease/exonuclease/phosphatase domain-containing protein n=1 Tax=Sesamum radiatum TaxID=300843 RepID=A0AAW2RZY3_SESRA